ncbi:uncharacterized protein [Ptychodera flava]|uniref:uncharacterized protein n=1 Tax=Ptychodera flava TaxID=63121 RepID=UPI00396A9BE2
MCKFLSVLASSNLDQNRTISKAELTEAFKNTTEFTTDHAKTLFGDISDVNVVFDKLDINDDGQISFNELRRFAEKKGIDIESQFIGYDRKNINGLAEFLDMLKETILINLKRLYITHRDIDRTVAVDVDYLSALDFDMEEDDKVFAVKQGAVAAKRFLKHYVTKYDPPMKADSPK